MEEHETGILLRALAHDFNNALHIVAGSAAALLDGSAANEEREVLQDIVQAADQAIRLVRLLQCLGRGLAPAREAVLLADLLDQVMLEIESATPLEQTPCFEPCVPVAVSGDARALVEALSQLLLPLAGGQLYVTAELPATPPTPGRPPMVRVEAVARAAADDVWESLAAALQARLEQTRMGCLPVTVAGWILSRLGAEVTVDRARSRLQVYLPLAD